MMKSNYADNLYDLSPPVDDFRADVIRGLSARNKEVPSKYLYDETGAQLFEQICELPEYYPARTELTILRHDSAEITALLGAGCLVIEYGSGASVKTRLLLDQLAAPAGYIPIDISREQLRETARALAGDYPHLQVQPVCADFSMPLEVPAVTTHVERRVVYFPGSTIGNFTPGAARQLLRQTARLCGRNGALLMGADLKKDPRVLDAAYNDRQGVTAAFNRNLLVRINRELQADFDTAGFWHHAFYNPREGRVEMHLVSRADRRVSVGGEQFAFAEGESICTEYSHKYSLRELRALAEAAGFSVQKVWTDERRYFSVLYMTPSARA